MLISIIQSDILWENKSGNFKRLDALITPLIGTTDIIILPEMFNTGFSMNPERLSESPKGETFDWMSDLSVRGNFGVCGSYIVEEEGHYFNRWVFVSPDNQSWFYNKRHLFSISGENKLFSKGKERLIFSFKGVRICPSICYDLRFPVWSRNIDDYDLMINSANWPESRSDVWDILLRARAIENQCYVAGANRIGNDGVGIKYSGDSVIINPRGGSIASGGQREVTVTCEISMSELSDFRKKFPVFNDADDFLIRY